MFINAPAEITNLMSKLIPMIAMMMILLTGCIRFTYVSDSEAVVDATESQTEEDGGNGLESIIEDGVDTIKQGKVGVEIYKDF